MTSIATDHPALTGRTGRGVSIAVIDSGVNAGHPHIGGVAGGVAFDTVGAASDDVLDRLGHGTAVTAAIQEKAPEAEVYVVKVFDDALATSVATLVRAIDWATDRGARLVNLSLGTPHAHRAERLQPALDRASVRGTVVVSAFGDDGASWLPGSLPGAVGVVLDRDCPRHAVRLVERTGHPLGADTLDAPDRLLIAASPYPRPIPGVPVERNLNGISFAVANATGVLARLVEHRPEADSPALIISLLTELTGSD